MNFSAIHSCENSTSRSLLHPIPVVLIPYWFYRFSESHYLVKKSAIEDGINYLSYFMGSMALDARDRLKVNEIVPRVGLHGILMR